MDNDKRVEVNSNKAARCGWCGSYESEKWWHDYYRTSIWCSQSCFFAGHFWDFIFFTVVFLIIDFTLISVQLISSLPLTLNTVVLFSVLISLTSLLAIASYAGYFHRSKISQRVY